MKIPAKAVSIFESIAQGGVASAIFNLFMGRSTFFAIVFVTVGIIGFFEGKDLTSFAAFVTAMQGLVVLHSWKEDVRDQKAAELELRKSQSNAQNQ